MKLRNILLIIPLMAASVAFASEIIPAPVSERMAEGVYNIGNSPAIYMNLENTEDSRRLRQAVGAFIPEGRYVNKESKGDIRLHLLKSGIFYGSPEGYVLEIRPSGVDIYASGAAGLFYGVQTLRGLVEANGRSLQCRVINDNPRFAYRGLMLDVSRHFRDAEFVKKQLDAMARLKLNNFHFHLTDGAGWRVQTDAYPRLTEYAAWRPGNTWKEWNEMGNGYLEEGSAGASGGYYTKDELRDIVAYAADRYITVVPEIEMPSHSEEVMAAYPGLLCTDPDGHTSDFCPSNDSTYRFLETVLDEVMEIFPSHYIHIGGDEAPKTAWRTCSRCRELMEREGYDSVDKLQSHLIKTIERYLNAHGRDIIGWDEIMEGGLAPNATVMSWRGTAGGEKAAHESHKVIMTPGRYCYLDGYQDAPYSQPEAIGGYLPLELAYSYEPVPESLQGKPGESFISGLQGNLFTEYVPTGSHAEYMLYPRMYAIAERGWSSRETRDYNDFRARAVSMANRMREEGYNTFDLEKEIGNRSEAKAYDGHLASGKPVTYIISAWKNYPANGELTLTDGLHGGWNYNDSRWQGFLSPSSERMDVVIDLGETMPIHRIGADFMQICQPDVWMPAKVEIWISDNNVDYTLLTTVNHNVVRDDAVSFKNFGWEGEATARYIRYKAWADDVIGGIMFVDEITVE